MSINVDKYVKMDPIDHILNRPDTYVGSIRQKTVEDYVATIKEQDGNLNYVISKEKITYSPALLRIFVEALSNAIDNVQRSKEAGVNMTKIKVSINKETGETSVYNDGVVIPVQESEKEKVYVHTMIFGQLHTSSNYNDNEERLVSGRNGLGIKLTNVFSKKFRVKGVDPTTGKMFQQEWSENMKEVGKVKITSSSLKNGYTEVSWTPDFEKFKMKEYTDDILKLYTKYVYDAAMLTKVNVYLNETKLPVKSLQDYAKLYESPTNEISYFKSVDCEAVLTSAREFEAVSFVNGVYTMNGGVHVDAWSEAIFRPLVDSFNKPNKPQITIKDVKQYFRLFVVATVVNPDFTSQSKTELSGPNVQTHVEKKNINSILKWENTKQISDIIAGKEMLVLKKAEGKKKGFTRIEGLDDANNAGKKNAADCTLILCEGLSAKTYAVKGIETGAFGKTGRDWFGIYPLRGKILNVRNSNATVIGKNREITDVIQTLGLRYGVDYKEDENFSTLRYGKLLIITDADTDGKHIEGLIMNFMHHLFPTILERETPFIVDMMTPIARFTMKGGAENIFYDLHKADLYFKENEKKISKVKYYKGLGTSSDSEIEETFGKRIIQFKKDEKTDETMRKVFMKSSADARKEWLSQYDPNVSSELDEDNLVQSFSNFIDEEMIKFSIDDCKRSIPHIMDGLKESQRKILYACFLRNLNGDTLKVAQLAGYVAEKTNYHHGEQNLFDTITKMANEFVGSNNIPLLYRDGQFGTRLQGGKDAASGRYIFTRLETLTRLLYRKEDDQLLERIIDDGDIVEPKFYIPILPMILINGCSAGIGTGWSCNVPCYNPLEVIKAIETWLENDGDVLNKDDNIEISVLPQLTPWYRGFKGKIEKAGEKKFITYGVVEGTTVSELPVGMWTDDFKESLNTMKEEKHIKDYKNHSTANLPNFSIIESSDGITCSINSLKLSTNLHTSNIVLFDENGKIKKYESLDEIIDGFSKVRYKYYKLRKESILRDLELEAKILKNKHRFLEEVIEEKIKIMRKKKDEIVKILETSKYDKIEENYDYLLKLQIWNLSEEKLDELKKELETVMKKIALVKKTTEKEMWRRDLDEFKTAYLIWLEEMSKTVSKTKDKTKGKIKGKTKDKNM